MLAKALEDWRTLSQFLASPENGSAKDNAGKPSQRPVRGRRLVGGVFRRSGGFNLGLRLWFCALFIGLSLSALGQSVTLGWIASPSPDITGYIVSYGTVSGTYAYSDNFGLATNATVSNLQAGMTYYFVVSDYDTFGLTSVWSGEISYYVPTSTLSNAVVT